VNCLRRLNNNGILNNNDGVTGLGNWSLMRISSPVCYVQVINLAKKELLIKELNTANIFLSYLIIYVMQNPFYKTLCSVIMLV